MTEIRMFLITLILLLGGLSLPVAAQSSESASSAEPATEFDPQALVARMRATLEAALFSEHAFGHPRTQMMLLELEQAAGQGASAEQLVEIARNHQDRLPFSHFWIQPPASAASGNGDQPVIALTEPQPGLFLMQIDSFSDLQAAWVQQSFQTLVDANARGLIIDLRNNRGGTYSSGFVAAHLRDESSSSGTLFARPVRQPILAGALDRFPSVAVQDIESVEHLGRLIRENGAFTLTIRATEPYFAGPVVMLTSHQTASASEPLVYNLQLAGRVTVIGEPTAGEMLSADTIDIGQGWDMFVPVLDYIAADGQRLDLLGVTPDVLVPAEHALEVALQHMETLEQVD